MEHLNEESTIRRVLRVIGKDTEIIDGVTYKNANQIEFDGVTYVVSHKAVLTLHTTNECNACCGFCCNGITFSSKDNRFLEQTQSLHRAVDFAKLGGIRNIAYSGGEPTSKPQDLVELVTLTLPHFQKGILHSNGYGMFIEVEGNDGATRPLIEELVRLGIFGVTISRSHHDPQKNMMIMNFKGKFQGLTDEQLENFASLRSIFFSPRLSCLMTKGGIENFNDVLDYITFGEQRGIQRFIFRLATGIPDEFAKKTIYAETNRELKIDLDELKTFLENAGFKETFSLHKSDSHVHSMRRGNIVVDLDQSSEEVDPDPKIRRMIFMPNDIVYTSWIDPSAILFRDDVDRVIARATTYDSTIHTRICENDKRSPSKKISRELKERVDILLSRDAIEKKRFPIDLHVHSNLSDGRTDPTHIAEQAANGGIRVLTLTDHNFFPENYNIIRQEMGRLGIEIPFPAAEVNTVFHNEAGVQERKYHVLVYGQRLLEDQEFAEFIEGPLRAKNQFLRTVVKDLIEKNDLDIPGFDEMLRGVQSDGSYIHPYKKHMTRTLLASYLQKCLPGMSIDEIKQNYLPPVPSEVSYADPIDTVQLIERVKDLGGVAGLAHPGWDRPFPGFENSIKRVFEIIYFLKKRGMQGLEAMTRHHDRKPEEQLNSQMYQFARDTGLFMIGGSDYHGKGDVDLGYYGLVEAELDVIKNILARTNNLSS